MSSVWFCLCVCICVCVCLSVSISVCLFLSDSLSLFLHPSPHPSLPFSVCLRVCNCACVCVWTQKMRADFDFIFRHIQHWRLLFNFWEQSDSYFGSWTRNRAYNDFLGFWTQAKDISKTCISKRETRTAEFSPLVEFCLVSRKPVKPKFQLIHRKFSGVVLFLFFRLYGTIWFDVAG